MGSEWPDKRDKTGFGSMTRGGGNFSRGHPPKLNGVGSGVAWVTGLFSPCVVTIDALQLVTVLGQGWGLLKFRSLISPLRGVLI